MQHRKKYLILGLTAMFVLNLTDIATTFWNDPTLKAEANPVFIKYKLNAIELVALLLGLQLFYSILFSYHAIVFNGYDFAGTNKTLRDFLKRILGFSAYNNENLLKRVTRATCSMLNFLGIYALWGYCISKLIISVHNSFLAILSNNSRFRTNYETKKVDIYLNDNTIWDTFLGKWILAYNKYDIEHQNQTFKLHNQVECALVGIVLIIYFSVYYKKYQKKPLA